jgi:hypothetical protein
MTRPPIGLPRAGPSTNARLNYGRLNLERLNVGSGGSGGSGFTPSDPTGGGGRVGSGVTTAVQIGSGLP